MNRLLLVPAAGRGSRLGADRPKALVLVAGVPMIERILDLHSASVDAAVVVAAPGARDAFAALARERHLAFDVAIQPQPTGMLDGILEARDVIAAFEPRRVVITWCDQLAIEPATIERLRALSLARDAPAMILPTITMDAPYIHLQRDETGRIIRVLHRREGDVMPPQGEADMGLFDLSLRVFMEDLPAYAASSHSTGPRTGETNFLPFVPWLAERALVTTFPGIDPVESLGVNTLEDLARIERHLAERGR